MTIYLQRHNLGAGRWIYAGYASAWSHYGFTAQFIDSLKDINPTTDYALMITGSLVLEEDLNYIKKSKFCILYCAPSAFPKPWGDHPNFQCPLSLDLTKELNKLPNVIKWTFGDLIKEHFPLWSDLKTVPLAFDSLNYKRSNPDTSYAYDVCFIGGVADNGFNEKIHIMKDCLDAFSASDLKCAFFIGQNLPHEQENYILGHSKICLNIHDQYQRSIGSDTNERTFKALGVNGLLVSDDISQLRRLFPDIFVSNSKEDLVQHCQALAAEDIKNLNKIKIQHQGFVKENHTYIKRVEQFLSYAN